MNRNSLLQAILWPIALVVVFVAVVGINMWLTGKGFGESARTFQAIVTAITLIAAAMFAVFKLQIFRDLAPHLTIAQEVSHRPIGDSYIHIYVAATLENSSKVKIELKEGLFVLQQIEPVEDEDIEALYAEIFVDKEAEDILWPTLDEVRRKWAKNTLIIEPGEVHQEVCEFVVTSGVKSVLAYVYFYNPYSSTPRGWYSTAIYDIP